MQLVRIIDPGYLYRTYSDMATEMGLSNWVSGDPLPTDEDEGYIVCTMDSGSTSTLIHAVTIKGQEYIIGDPGVMIIDTYETEIAKNYEI